MFDRQKEKSEEESAATPSTPPATNSMSTVGSPRTSAVIGSTINIKGEVTGDENLIIDGSVEGTVDLGSKDVTVGNSGNVKANIAASVIRVDGEVQGDMQGKEKVIVSKSGRVKGNIVAPRVTLEDGAKFKGSIDMDPAVSATAVTPIKTTPKGESKAAPSGASANTSNNAS